MKHQFQSAKGKAQMKVYTMICILFMQDKDQISLVNKTCA